MLVCHIDFKWIAPVYESISSIHCFCVILEEWLSDGYRFKQHGVTLIPRNNPQFKKVHYHINTKTGLRGDFKKFVYRQLQVDSSCVIVHYMGDETTAEDFPHGTQKSFVPNCLSLSGLWSNTNA